MKPKDAPKSPDKIRINWLVPFNESSPYIKTLILRSNTRKKIGSSAIPIGKFTLEEFFKI